MCPCLVSFLPSRKFLFPPQLRLYTSLLWSDLICTRCRRSIPCVSRSPNILLAGNSPPPTTTLSTPPAPISQCRSRGMYYERCEEMPRCTRGEIHALHEAAWEDGHPRGPLATVDHTAFLSMLEVRVSVDDAICQHEASRFPSILPTSVNGRHTAGNISDAKALQNDHICRAFTD